MSGRASVVTRIVAGVAVLAVLAAGAADAAPTPRQVERFWTPRRMAAARPLEMTVGPDGRADVHLGPRPRAATASYSVVESPEVPPRAWNGRLYVRQAGKEGFCSATATAIDSPTRRLVLTAGHCVNSGPKDGKPGVWSTYLEFVPGFNLGAAPYGTFALAGGGRQIDGVTSYIVEGAKRPLTYGPYFSASTVGRLVAGL